MIKLRFSKKSAVITVVFIVIAVFVAAGYYVYTNLPSLRRLYLRKTDKELAEARILEEGFAEPIDFKEVDDEYAEGFIRDMVEASLSSFNLAEGFMAYENIPEYNAKESDESYKEWENLVAIDYPELMQMGFSFNYIEAFVREIDGDIIK